MNDDERKIRGKEDGERGEEKMRGGGGARGRPGHIRAMGFRETEPAPPPLLLTNRSTPFYTAVTLLDLFACLALWS